jgi:hypothetical protein
MTTDKALIHSVISTAYAPFMTGDLEDFYLGTPWDSYKFIRIPLRIIPLRIRDLYNLAALAVNGFVYAEVRRGRYGLPQASIHANQLLHRKLGVHGYHPVPITPGL